MWRSSKRQPVPQTSSGTPPAADTTSVSRNPSANPRRQNLSPRTTLSEALKNNPFRLNHAKDDDRERSPSAPDPVTALNNDLKVIANVYPDVQIEVLRKLLTRFDGDSRLQIGIEQLYRYKSKWAGGQILNPPRDADDEIAAEDLFRAEDYVAKCKQILATEFKSLNRSAIDAVLAEVNHSYIKARPILHEIYSKSWRSTFVSFFRKRKGNEEVPAFLLERGCPEPTLHGTGSLELDQELEALFFAPTRLRRTCVQQASDFELAQMLNQSEAENSNALFECQCCYNDIPFEQITTCTLDPSHIICFDCVRRGLNEALFGQNWTMSVDPALSTLRCMAPQGDSCCGHIPPYLVERAILQSRSGAENWTKFSQRLALENLNASGVSLQSCPFCPYAEIAERQSDASNPKISWRFRPRPQVITMQLVLIALLIELILPSVLVLLAVTYLINPTYLISLWSTSLLSLRHAGEPTIFRCLNPTCLRKSCTKCSKPFHLPHTCDEPLLLSLRTAVEAARTAALKRTCPRCGTSFVKSSGCNKLVCVCGYAMCYLCRKNIGRVSASNRQPFQAGENIQIEGPRNAIDLQREAGDFPPAPANGQQGFFGGLLGIADRNAVAQAPRAADAAADDNALVEVGEGYRHFCPHFRPIVGQKCTECDKCDLYKTEDEDAAVRRAGEEAERTWREREGLVGTDISAKDGRKVQGLQHALEGISGGTKSEGWDVQAERFVKRLVSGHWTMQGLVDWIVDRTIVVES